jgi:ComF family protein
MADASAPLSAYLAQVMHQARQGASGLVDLLLPPRCPGCGMVVGGQDRFCVDCWATLDFIVPPSCASCDLPLPVAIDPGALCGQCMAQPPPFARAWAPLAYGEKARALVMRLKYGRRIGAARLMADLMATRLAGRDSTDDPPLLVPVPLHRWRIWSRGFNQSALIGRHLAERFAWTLDVDALVRVRRTDPLRGLGKKARAKEVRGAFRVPAAARDRIAGRTIMLVDDVFTSGATASACARALRHGGAARVEVVAFARVLDGRGDSSGAH